ncbi:S-layer homology domain-containing protein [Paenibacillus sp. GSMTC-2017]|uniref:glycosyl hydrolase family 8 n=1 Tax=Paenibacillus sp. GSMTC-2017 TaxID=2794350 RepID=UPI0018D6E018|nr:glycosyl hydrolase family 8 [Paenibacillus sp. GSMTC-2017]MBH5319638.1 S-layer homology domain-containing protein [Paenibacillus sp. GSMTC-2017]
MKHHSTSGAYSIVKLTIVMTVITALILMLITLQPIHAQSGKTNSSEKALRPFPQHMASVKGTIKPNHVSQQQMDKEVTLLYNEWKKKYVRANPYDANQYYVWYNDGGWNGDAITVSEAHGYGMIVTAIMAGHDKKAKSIFDGMYRFFRAHPSELDPDLMAWQQADRGGKIIDVNGTDSATDGDMDIAYSLLLADKQWGSNGAINYKAEAIKVINAIMENEVHPTDFHLQLGDWVKVSDSVPSFAPASRPSDFMLQHMKEFSKATGDTRWDKVIDNTYGIITDIHKNYSPKTGLLPDFVYKDPKDGKYKPVDQFKWPTEDGFFLESELDGAHNYNSCRTPWRIATDYLVTGDSRAHDQLTALNTFLKGKHKTPAEIWSGYSLDGKTKLSEWDGGLDFTAPFMVSATIDSSNQQWLNDLWDYHTDAVNPTAVEWRYYYGNSIRLLSMIVVSGNWWSPTGVASTDIAGHSAQKEMITALSEGIINGYPNGTVKPDELVTRAEFTVMVAKAMKLEGEGATLTFMDTRNIPAWAKQSAAQVVEAGLLKNVAVDLFHPAKEITQGEVATILKAAGHTWGEAALETFNPESSLTRAEAVTLLAGLDNK